MSPGCSRGVSPRVTSMSISFAPRWTWTTRRSPDLKDFIPATNASTDSTRVPLMAIRMSPSISSELAAALPGTSFPIRTWWPGAGWAVPPRNGRRGKESEDSDAFAAAAAREHRERRTKKQSADATEILISPWRPMTLPPTYLCLVVRAEVMPVREGLKGRAPQVFDRSQVRLGSKADLTAPKSDF